MTRTRLWRQPPEEAVHAMDSIRLAEFLVNPAAGSLMWHVDAKTDEIVATCKCCGAEMRIPKGTDGEVTFAHEAECSWMREVEENDESHARKFMDRLVDVLDEEPDEGLVFSAAVFVGALTCEAAAEAGGRSLGDVVEQCEDALKKLLEHFAKCQARASAA
jgi:hypothetical protein